MNIRLEKSVFCMTDSAMELRMKEYNRKVIQYQDDAFTLACDLLGDEGRAAEVVAAAFQDAFRGQSGSFLEFQLDIFRRIISACRNQARDFAGPGIGGMHANQMTNEEKMTLILVDRLKLNYSEASRVLQKPAETVRKLLASARLAYR